MKKLLVLLLTFMMMITITACGSKPTEPTKEETDLEYITKKGTMIVGITDFEPMDFLDENGKWIGFDAELAELVGKELNVEVIFQLIQWSSKETELAGKTIDCIWNGMTWDEDRAANMEMTDWYMVNEQVFVVNKNSLDKFTTVEDLSGITVAAEGGSAGEDYILSDLTSCTYIEKGSMIDALMELNMGTVDAAVIDNNMAYYLINKANSDFAGLTVLEGFISPAPEYYSIAFRKGSDATAKVNDILKALTADGTVKKLAEKYGLEKALLD